MFKTGELIRGLGVNAKNFKKLSTLSLTDVQFCDGVKKITMVDQKSRNSLSLGMMQNLLDNINRDMDNKDLRVIIITAQGPIFSAGHNLKELTPEAGKGQHEKVFQLATQLMCSIIECPVPVVAQVDGLAAAAGCQLVAQCDIAICTENSKFSTPGSNFGIFCSTPGIPLARKGLKATILHMLLTGLPITASEAKASGLVSKVCAPENLESEVKTTTSAIISRADL
ncbi:hypothetical protein NQ317_011855 [Molorchus minor]|uniref:Enoyl-CoA hydratase domain-containing protein 3, mitochondrial n=1 Tax=Molorchus minor TaxID=1323400 RepID=A0ABQ9JLY9_9CUCU|nr:hypothetical protein NQ317_011855 [Molorchus minor]